MISVSKQLQDELEKLTIYVNRNVIPNDSKLPFNPSGIRLGTPAITSRGFKEKEARLLAQMVVDVIKNFDNQKVKIQIKKEVQKLVKKFSIYKDLKW